MGRKKIAIERIADHRRRQVTFSRRKVGLMKKAYELSVLCNCDIGLLIFPSNAKKMFTYSSCDMNELVLRYTEHVEDGDDVEALRNLDIERMDSSAKRMDDDQEENDASDNDQSTSDSRQSPEQTPHRKRQRTHGTDPEHDASATIDTIDCGKPTIAALPRVQSAHGESVQLRATQNSTESIHAQLSADHDESALACRVQAEATLFAHHSKQ